MSVELRIALIIASIGCSLFFIISTFISRDKHPSISERVTVLETKVAILLDERKQKNGGK